MAFNSIEPIGDRRGDLQAGIIASTLVNVNKKKGTKALSPADFMLDFDKPPEEDIDPVDTEAKVHKAFMGMVAVQKELQKREAQKKEKRKQKLIKEGKWNEEAEAKKEAAKIEKMKKQAKEEAMKLRAEKKKQLKEEK